MTIAHLLCAWLFGSLLPVIRAYRHFAPIARKEREIFAKRKLVRRLNGMCQSLPESNAEELKSFLLAKIKRSDDHIDSASQERAGRLGNMNPEELRTVICDELRAAIHVTEQAISKDFVQLSELRNRPFRARPYLPR